MQIVINGTDITDFIAFQGVKWSRNDVDGPNAGRNMAGNMVRDRRGTAIRMDISCRPLKESEHKQLMQLLEPEFISVSYDDPMFGQVSSVMYSNNHSSDFCIKRVNGEDLWHNVSFPLIDKNLR